MFDVWIFACLVCMVGVGLCAWFMICYFLSCLVVVIDCW